MKYPQVFLLQYLVLKRLLLDKLNAFRQNLAAPAPRSQRVRSLSTWTIAQSFLGFDRTVLDIKRARACVF